MKKFNLRYSSVALSMAAMSALTATSNTYAQETEEIVVTGTRQVIQNSIDQKRVETQIVDGLSSEEIGDIPALSIGEALETITGASSHRENGGASEVSIRGLGPFLTNTVLNGREATNGAGNRAVNFSIFPSELFNKIGIFKTQSASFIEGAVGGQIRLDTKRPIEHGKQSIQVNLKGAYNDDEQDIRGGQDLGYRGTISYIDQFETENLGTFGVSLGVQIRDETNPEREFTRSNTPRVCDLDNTTGLPTSTTCADDENFLRGATPNDDGEFATDEDRESFAFLSSSAQFRQNITDDERNSFFGAFQWQPNEKLDLNLDLQWSERIQEERRSDFLFAELNRNLNNADLVEFDGPSLALFEGAGQEIQLLGQDFVRDEEYQGIGFNLEYQVNEDLKVSFDASYSDTFRIEEEESFRFGDDVERSVSADFTSSDFIGIFGIENPDGSTFDTNNAGEFIRGAAADGTITAADVAAAFTDGQVTSTGIAGDEDAENRFRARVQEDIRENTIIALRGDFELQTENLGFVTSVEGGVRFSQLDYERRGNINSDFNLTSLDGGAGTAADPLLATDNRAIVIAEIANNCVDDSFDPSNFNFRSPNANCALGILRELGEVDGSNQAVIDALTPNNSFNGSSVDVEEDTFAAYLQANYESELFGFPARGNFGVRLVNTRVESNSFTAPFLLDVNDNGTFELDNPTNFNSPAVLSALGGDTFLDSTTDTFSYTELLPSATLVLDLSDTVLFRAGLFRGISRSDPALLGSRQQIGTVQEDLIDQTAQANGDILNITAQDLQDIITGQGLSGGSVDLEPFTSWNVDTAIEWYPNKDTILSLGAYYKKFRGGYQNTFVDSTFTIIDDGSGDTGDALALTGLFPEGGSIDITAPISSIETTDETSNLYGIEVTASHSFTYLPGILGGFGAKLSYNYASSDFEFEDDFAGEGIASDGSELIGLIPPADIFGLSRNVASAQLFWSGEKFDFQVIGKHRSQYFQQFVDTPGRIRFVDDNTVVEFRASYKLNDSIRFSFEALNLTDELRTDFRALDGNVAQVLEFGPRYFFGIRAKL